MLYALFILLSLISLPLVSSTITLSIRSSVPIDTQVILTWTRTSDDTRTWTLTDAPDDQTLPHDTYVTITPDRGTTGEEHVNFGFAGGHHLQAVDPDGNILATSNGFTVGDSESTASATVETIATSSPSTIRSLKSLATLLSPITSSAANGSPASQSSAATISSDSPSSTHSPIRSQSQSQSQTSNGISQSAPLNHNLATSLTTVPPGATVSAISPGSAGAAENGSGSKSKLGLILGLVFGILIFLVLISLFIFRRRRRFLQEQKRLAAHHNSMLEIRVHPELRNNALTVEVHLNNLPVDAATLESALSPSPTDGSLTMATVDGSHTGTDLEKSMQLLSEAATFVSLKDSMHTRQATLQNPSLSHNPVLPPLPPIPAQNTTTSESALTTDRPVSALTSGTTASTVTSRSVLRYQRAALQRECDQLRDQMARVESSMQASNEASAAQIGRLTDQIIWLSSQLAANQGHEGVGMFTDTPLAEEGELPPEYDSPMQSAPLPSHIMRGFPSARAQDANGAHTM